MKRSRRQKKISKVMGEFKDGALKSGGSGRKVTNPKQAIAIALSEAEGMNQGGIVGLAQMGSPFTNSIRPQRQTTMGPRSIAPMQQRGFQTPQQMGPMQRNFMQLQNQMRGMQQNPLELYQGYLGQKYIGPMAEEQQNKISQFVGAVSQAERQAFGNPQGGKTFGGRLQPGMLGSGLMPPMSQAPDVMPQLGRPMNQGGMMYSDIMNRPMFQTPQQRQGMGIMAGVAPVRGYEEGGMAVPEYSPKFLREEQPEEDSMGRMLFEFFVVDPDDPIDVGMATTSAALMAGGVTAPAAIATQLARMGYKGKKLYNLINKVEKLAKPTEGVFSNEKLAQDPNVLRKITKPVASVMAAREIPAVAELGADLGVMGAEAIYDMAQGYSGGGIASLPTAFLDFIGKTKLGKAGKILERAIDAGEATFDDILNAFRRGEIDEKQLGDLNKRLPEADQGTLVKPGQRLNVQDKTVSDAGTDRTGTGVLQDTAKKRGEPKMTEGDIATPPESKMPTPPKPPAKVADDAAEAAEEAVKKKDKKKITEKVGDAAQRAKRSKTGQAVSGLLRPITSPIKVGLPLTIGAVGINKLIESGVLDPYINDPRVQQAIQAGKSAYEAVTEFFGPELEALFPDTGERVELTESAQARLPEVEKARKEGFPEPSKDVKKDDGTGTPKPEATGIMKFLFGKDGIGGEPGFAGRLLEKTQDPRLQYQLAKAGQATEGRVPRNFLSDFVLAGAEYDQLQGKDETALMQNYEFLKERGKKDDEIFDLLVGKSSQADTLSLFVDLEQEIYDGLLKRPEYLDTEVGADGLTGLQRAARDARIIARQRLSGLAGGQASAPQDSDVTEILLQPAVQ